MTAGRGSSPPHQLSLFLKQRLHPHRNVIHSQMHYLKFYNYLRLAHFTHKTPPPMFWQLRKGILQFRKRQLGRADTISCNFSSVKAVCLARTRTPASGTLVCVPEQCSSSVSTSRFFPMMLAAADGRLFSPTSGVTHYLCVCKFCMLLTEPATVPVLTPNPNLSCFLLL